MTDGKSMRPALALVPTDLHTTDVSNSTDVPTGSQYQDTDRVTPKVVGMSRPPSLLVRSGISPPSRQPEDPAPARSRPDRPLPVHPPAPPVGSHRSGCPAPVRRDVPAGMRAAGIIGLRIGHLHLAELPAQMRWVGNARPLPAPGAGGGASRSLHGYVAAYEERIGRPPPAWATCRPTAPPDGSGDPPPGLGRRRGTPLRSPGHPTGARSRGPGHHAALVPRTSRHRHEEAGRRVPRLRLPA